MGNKLGFRSNALPLAKQVALMRQSYPHLEPVWKKNEVRWVGVVQPTAATKQYKVLIRYQLDSTPKVWIIEPELVTRTEDERIPHVYPGNRLCLYTPGRGEWTRRLSISDTIVPWTVLWIYYYEVWHATSRWLGGGHGMPDSDDDEPE